MSKDVISLFSGVGMADLALASAGFKTVATAEIDPWCRTVLAKRFPDAQHFDDVHDVKPEAILDEVDGIVGGFPCQDVSTAGTGAGLDGKRSGLWSEFARVIGDFNPRWVLIENVAALRGRGLARVLADLNELGYNARWDCIPAAAVGAPHMRDRIWILAMAHGHSFSDPGETLRTKKAMSMVDVTTLPANTKMPRAGFLEFGLVDENVPLATQRQAKARLQEGEMLLPSPAKSEPGWAHIEVVDRDGEAPAHPNQRFHDANTGRVVQKGVAQIATMFPDHKPASYPLLFWPTARAQDAKHEHATATDYELSRDPMYDLIHVRVERIKRGMWPTPIASERGNRSVENMVKGGGIELPLAVDMATEGLWPIPADQTREQAIRAMYPTPRASQQEWRTLRNAPSHGNGHGKTLSGEVNERERAEGRVPAPSSESAGNLNPQWVEWLMGLPAGWTNPDVSNEDLIPFTGWDRETEPRTVVNPPHRRKRLMACGNGLVPQCMLVALAWMD